MQAKEWEYPEKHTAEKHKIYCSCNKEQKHQGLKALIILDYLWAHALSFGNKYH